MALEDGGLQPLFLRREEQCRTLFELIIESDGQHKLVGLLPAHKNSERYNFSNKRMFSMLCPKTKRFRRNTFEMYYADKQQL